MKKMKKSALAAAVLLSLSMMGSTYAATTGTSVSAGQKINFGNYWQSKATSWTDGTKTQQSSYNKDTVTWRVLANNSGVLTLLSDKALYADAFDCTSPYSNIWGGSEISTTLNNTTAGSGFMGDAFTTTEQGLITTVAHDIYKDNGDLPPTGTVDTGNDTSEKIYLLDLKDLLDTSLFPDANSKKAQATDFAQNVSVYGNSSTAYVSSGNTYWWLRSPTLTLLTLRGLSVATALSTRTMSTVLTLRCGPLWI